LLLESLEDRALPSLAIGDVFYINLENHNFVQPNGNVNNGSSTIEQIQGNLAAPFINSLITPGNANAAMVSYATNYHNVLSTSAGTGPSIHPSEPNYVWQESGVNGPLNDSDPYPSNIVNSPNLSALLQAAGISWKSYQEDIDLATNSSGQVTSTPLPQSQWTVPLTSFNGTSPAYVNPYNGSDQYNFAAKHDGQLFFTATNGGDDTTTSNREVSHYAPLQQLQIDLNNNTVGRYNLITPDQYNDMHTALTGGFTYFGVTYTGDAANIAQGDNFLSKVIPMIEASTAFKNNGEIVIWNDESEAQTSADTSENDFNHDLTEIVISPLAKGNAFASTLNYTHSSDLKTLQEIFGVSAPGGGFLGDANTAGTNDLMDLYVPLLGINTITPQTVTDGNALRLSASATPPVVNGAPASVTYSLGAGAPSGASINDQTGLFTWTPSQFNGQAPGVYNISVVASESATTPSQTATTTLSITVGPSSTNQGSGQTARQKVAVGLTQSAEYFTNFITAAYQKYLNRTPDANGLAYWVNLMQNQGLSDEHLESGFIGSQEYINNHGGAGQGWVTGMYQNLLGRTPVASEVQYWVGQLQGGESTASIAFGFAASPERESDRVAADYQQYLGRRASASENSYWVNVFLNGGSNEQVIAGFVSSQEYFQGKGSNNIVDWLFADYRATLNRQPDQTGFNYWENLLK
jgi:hypothetical protein